MLFLKNLSEEYGLYLCTCVNQGKMPMSFKEYVNANSIRGSLSFPEYDNLEGALSYDNLEGALSIKE